MENIPPSYDAAISRNPWSLIAPHVPSAELCALNRVSKELHAVFAPCLWGNPASHFGTENDRVYVALTRFKRALKRVRLSVRELTHTLHLPPAQSEIYDGPHPEWLREVLEQLPNLQSLIVSRLPFFDHMALLALRSRSDNRNPSSESDTPPTFALRLLIASHCQNSTPQGLAESLDHFPHLAFLDFSYTSAARDQTVLARLGGLPQLQVLKLRNIHLRDEGIICLANAIGIRVRSLDVSENDLTDRSVKPLLKLCFEAVGDEHPNESNSSRRRTASNMPVEDWPSGFVRPDPAILDEFKDDSYDQRFVRRLTSKVVSRLPFEDLPLSGITHLFLSGNQLSVEGLASLIRSKKLHVLDAGTIDPPSATSAPIESFHLNSPGLERLVPVLHQCGQEITSLRTDHSLVTRKAPSVKEDPPLAVCELPVEGHLQAQEMDVTIPHIAELDNTEPPTYELDSIEIAPAYELPAMPVGTTSPVVHPQRKFSFSEEPLVEVRRGSAFSPEVVEVQDGISNEDPTPVLTATGLTPMAQAANGAGCPTLPSFESATAGIGGLPEGDSRLSLAQIMKERKDLRTEQMENAFGLMPYMLPKLRTITLIDIPCFEAHRKIVDALIAFITYCASEAKLASDEARLKPTPFHKAIQLHAQQGYRQTGQTSFALQRIVLEMAPSGPPHLARISSQRPFRSSKFTSRTLSSTEDADSEALWSASENDFTFFDDQEECGLPASETATSAQLPFSALPETIPVSPDHKPDSIRTNLPHQPQHRGGRYFPPTTDKMTDVVAELSAFRKERKAAYARAVASGVRYVDGYWPGEVKVVRDHRLGPSIGGSIDYYGNYFEKGGVYR